MVGFPSPSLAVSITALVVSLGGAGYSATGGTFFLGKSNSASTQTRLVTPLAGAAFRVDNTSTGVEATGMTIITNPTRPPLRVTSATKVANLNADKLDGIDSTGFIRRGADVTSTISFTSVPSNSCLSFNLLVTGARLGDAPILAFEGSTPPPGGLVILTQKVTGSDNVTLRACNVNNVAAPAVTDLGVRIITLR